MKERPILFSAELIREGRNALVNRDTNRVIRGLPTNACSVYFTTKGYTLASQENYRDPFNSRIGSGHSYISNAWTDFNAEVIHIGAPIQVTSRW